MQQQHFRESGPSSGSVQCAVSTVCNLPIRGDSDEGVGEDCRCEYRHVAAPCLLSPAPGLLIAYSVQSAMYSMDSGNPLQSLIAQKASEKFLILLSSSQRPASGCAVSHITANEAEPVFLIRP